MPGIVRWASNAPAIEDTTRMFRDRSQFQNVLGAIDGSHIYTTAPKTLASGLF